MVASILNTVKKMLGILSEDTTFDPDVIAHINSVFMILHQMGVGTEEVFQIDSDDNSWSEFVTEENTLAAVKTYMYLKVRLAFDPPQTAGLMSSFERQIQELEYRLFVQVEELEEA